MPGGSFLSRQQILRLIQHRGPFLFLSYAENNVPGQSVVGVLESPSGSRRISRAILLEGLGQSGALIIRQVR